MSMRLAVAPALTAAFAMMSSPATVNAHPPDIIADDVTQEDVAALTEFLVLRNAKGQESKVVIITNERWDAYWQKKMKTAAGWEQHKSTNGMDNQLLDHLAAKGIGNPHYFAMNVMSAYSPSTGYQHFATYPYQRNSVKEGENWVSKFIGPMAISLNNPNLENLVRDASPFCTVVLLPTVHDGQAWTKSWLGIEQQSERTVYLPREYGSEFVKLIRHHELGHCMGLNEVRADYAAATLLLKESGNIGKTLEFLSLIRSMRAVYTLYPGMAEKYYGTFLAIDLAVREFKMNGNKVPHTQEQIWSIAAQLQMFDTSGIDALKNRIRKHEPEMLPERNYNGLADHFIRNFKNYEGSEKKIATEMIKSLRTLAVVAPMGPSDTSGLQFAPIPRYNPHYFGLKTSP